MAITSVRIWRCEPSFTCLPSQVAVTTDNEGKKESDYDTKVAGLIPRFSGILQPDSGAHSVHRENKINSLLKEKKMETRKAKTRTVAMVVLCVCGILAYALIATGGGLEPSAPPGPTMKTLDEVQPTWSQKLDASERFELVLDGEAVLDKETGLVWERSPDTTTRTWTHAIGYCYNKTVGGRKGWRLPTIEELTSLVDSSQSNPALPNGHPFSNVLSGYYRSSTSYSSSGAWSVRFASGSVQGNDKSSLLYVWCVRGGHGYDGY